MMDFVIENGILEKYTGNDNNVIIPDGVKAIGRELFQGERSNWFRNEDLESVVISEGVETIESSAFRNCVKLKSITIPNTLKTIGFCAFGGCIELLSVVIPDSVKTIETGAFEYCKFDSITVPSSVEEVGFGAFYGTKEIRIYDNIQSDISMIGGTSDEKEFFYILTILSKDTGEIISKVPVASDGTYPNRRIIESCGSENGKFDLPLLDQNFKKFKSPKVRTFIADFRLNNPFDLSDENRDMYAKYLKRTAKNRDKEKEDKTFEIKGKTLKSYKGIDTLSVVRVPEGISKLGMGAFGKDDNTITEIILPEGLTTIDRDSYGNRVFSGCQKLKKVTVPESLIDIPFNAFDIDIWNSDSEKWEKAELEYNEYDNGLYFGNDDNPYVCLVKVSNEGIENITVHEGCKIICGNVFLHCDYLKRIVLPESLVKIEERSEYEWVEDHRGGRNEKTYPVFTKSNMEVNMPVNYFKTTMKFPGKVTFDLLSTKWENQVSFNDLAWIYLFQTGKKFEDFCNSRFPDKKQAVREMLDVCTDNPDEKAIIRLAKFAYGHKAVIGKEVVAGIVHLAEKEKIESEELKLLKSLVGDVQTDEMDELEQYCHANYDFNEIEKTISKSSINLTEAFKNCSVLYKNTGNKVPEFVVKCVLAQYIDSFSGNEPEPKIIPDADRIVSEFDEGSFMAFLARILLRTIGHVDDTVRNMFFGVEPIDRLLSLAGRFGDEKTITTLIEGYRNREEYYQGDKITSKLINYYGYLKAAILLSDSETAFSYCVEKGWKKQYAKIRGKKVTELGDINEGATEEEILIAEAVALYEDITVKIKGLIDSSYSEPIIQEAPKMATIQAGNKLAKKFFATIRDYYKNKQHMWSYDYRFKPDDLYNYWINNGKVEYAQIGISLPIGLLIASYMFESKDVSGRMIFCRNKWELNGDASEPTRVALQVSPDADKWNVFMQTGYEKYDM